MIRPFIVTASIRKESEFTTDANSPEEAEGIVLDWREDGEEGSVTSQEFEVVDVVPADESSMGDFVKEAA